MPDGRSVPVCVVEAPPVTTAPPPIKPPSLQKSSRKLGWAKSPTSRSAFCRSKRSSTAGRANLSSSTIDVALIEVPDIREWSASIFLLGQLGPLADLSTQNLSLNVIGCPVRATGGVSGPLRGRVAALFYRYKAVGGREYVSDFLIGSRDDTPLGTHPGDSGAIWVVDLEGTKDRLMPLAIQWGGAVFGNADESLPLRVGDQLEQCLPRAWVNGGGNDIPNSKLQTISKPKLRGIYDEPSFLPSKPLGQIDPFL